MLRPCHHLYFNSISLTKHSGHCFFPLSCLQRLNCVCQNCKPWGHSFTHSFIHSCLYQIYPEHLGDSLTQWKERGLGCQYPPRSKSQINNLLTTNWPSYLTPLSKIPTWKVGTFMVSTFEGCGESEWDCVCKCPALVRADNSKHSASVN